MHLALNTFVYEVAGWSAENMISSAARLGFKYVEWASYDYGNPDKMDEKRRHEVVKMFKESGLYCAQMLLAKTAYMASLEAKKRQAALDHMKRSTDFLLELGGRQVLVCWGCGVLEMGGMPEQHWLHSVESLRKYGEWAGNQGVLVGLELDPHVYFVVNNTVRMIRVLEDVGLPNIFSNIDIGHLFITREPPAALDKFKNKILQVHLSETDTFAHTNSILGTGKADFRPYVDKALELGIEENCRRYDEPCVAGIEMGEPGGEVDDPERWVRESLAYLAKVLPNVTR